MPVGKLYTFLYAEKDEFKIIKVTEKVINDVKIFYRSFIKEKEVPKREKKMTRTQPGVGIILLNWNGYKDTYDCLKSLESLSYPHFKVFVVDNCSSDNSYQQLLQDQVKGDFHLSIEIIQSGGNLGFAGGNNIGIQAAYQSGLDYIWLLNNDTVVDPRGFNHLD